MSGHRRSRQAGPGPPAALNRLDGVLVVDKPAGPTSHDIVDVVRRNFRLRKVGHGGTLDPRATGVLVLLLGRGTKLSAKFMASDKVYEGVMRLGVETDTQDADGAVVREADWRSITREQVEGAMAALTGDVWQEPPMVSAKKINGVPLYKLARRGQTVERAAKLVHVYRFSLDGFDLPEIDFTVRCSRGAYVRTLCADAGAALGCGAHLAALRRTWSGDIGLDRSRRLEDILEMSEEELEAAVIPLARFGATGRERRAPRR